MGSKVIRVVLAFVLAAVGTGVLVKYVDSARAEAVADEAQVNVLVVDMAVDKGTPAAELAPKVRTIQVPARLRSADAVSELAELGELRATVDLLPGEQVVKGRFAEAGTALRGKAPDGLLQVTVTVDAAQAIGGNLRAGDTVGVLLSFKPFEILSGGKTPDTTHLELHKVTVTNVQVAGQAADAAKASGDVPAAIGGEYLVTLAVTAPQAEQVVFTAQNGTIWLSAEPEDAPTDGTKLVDRGNVYSTSAR
jgi:pilus assembly protein CpaB